MADRYSEILDYHHIDGGADQPQQAQLEEALAHGMQEQQAQVQQAQQQPAQ